MLQKPLAYMSVYRQVWPPAGVLPTSEKHSPQNPDGAQRVAICERLAYEQLERPRAGMNRNSRIMWQGNREFQLLLVLTEYF